MRECAAVFESTHAEEVSKYRTTNRMAIESLFLTLFPESERAYASIRLLGLGHFKSQKNFPFSSDPKLLESAKIWSASENNKMKIDEESKSLEVRNVNRLIKIYGNSKVSTKSVGDDYYCPSLEFNMNTSNNALAFSDGNTKATRVGSISCYPGAFSDLNNSRAIFTVLLDKAPQTYSHSSLLSTLYYYHYYHYYHYVDQIGLHLGFLKKAWLQPVLMVFFCFSLQHRSLTLLSLNYRYWANIEFVGNLR